VGNKAGHKAGSKRRDIQGLRAVAVIAVILDHLFHWPSGGFVGVDIFFVISGFLITSILLREFDSSGRISFANFYARRVRRIVPAATVVLAVTAAFAAVVFAGSKANSIVIDAIASFFFVSNWRSAVTGTDYFQLGSAPSPLQHFWSLSVEEQFYFVWPIVMLLVLVLATRLTRRGRAVRPRLLVGALMSVVILASFLWALAESTANPTVAYFSTLTRTWELGIGALLAIGARLFVNIPPRVRTVMAYGGLAGIAASVFGISSATVFPAPGALLPVLSTALVLASGINTESRYNGLLTNRVSQYVGDISYSLYLWHLPVITFLAVFIPSTSRVYFLGALVLTVALAAITYRLVEQPLTHSPFLTRYPDPLSRSAAVTSWRTRFARQALRATAALAVTVLITVIGVSAYIQVKGAPATAVAREEVVELDPSLSPTEVEIAYDLADAINATEWPTLVPSIDEIASSTPLEDQAGCPDTVVSDPDSCSFGDSQKPSIVVFGDSTGITLLASVREAYGDEFFIRGLTLAGCPVIDISVVKTDDHASRCLQHREESLAAIHKMRPEMVFLSTNYEWSNSANLNSGAEGEAAVSEWAAAAQSTVEQIGGSAGDVVFVTPPPEGPAIADCATAVSKPIDCLGGIPAGWATAHAAEASVVNDRVHFVDTLRLFCGQSGRCPIFAGDTPLKRDGIHTAREWAIRIAPVLRERTEAFRSQ
jgi:peptidoglycan/LPS O-acetylase OafA/YrhL